MGGVQPVVYDSSHGASSDASVDSIPQTEEKSTPSGEKSSDKIHHSRKENSETIESNKSGLDNENEVVYTEQRYNAFGWARHAEAITKNELDDLYSKIQKKGSLKKFPHSAKGEAIIEVNDEPHTTLGVNNVFVFVTGTKSNPRITEVIRFQEESKATMEIIKELLYERGKFSHTHSSYLVEEGSAIEYRRNRAITYNEYAQEIRRGSSRGQSEGTARTDRDGYNGRGTSEKAQSNVKRSRTSSLSPEE